MVGEVRDAETAAPAIQAALTGHLVFSTLHTNDAPSAVTRLVNIGIEPYLVAATLRGVLAQRLVRKTVHTARRRTSPSRSSARPSSSTAARLRISLAVKAAVGAAERVSPGELASSSCSFPTRSF